jgi:hypothetical protein
VRLGVEWLLLACAAYLWWSFNTPSAPNPLHSYALEGSRALAEVINWVAGCVALVVGLVLLGLDGADNEKTR